MNKYLISDGSAVIGAELLDDYGGMVVGKHEEEGTVGYWCKLTTETSEEWNAKGHGLTYDMAIVSLYLLVKKNELPLSKEAFLLSKFYLEN